jgi:hypothetical protein
MFLTGTPGSLQFATGFDKITACSFYAGSYYAGSYRTTRTPSLAQRRRRDPPRAPNRLFEPIAKSSHSSPTHRWSRRRAPRAI